MMMVLLEGSSIFQVGDLIFEARSWRCGFVLCLSGDDFNGQ